MKYAHQIARWATITLLSTILPACSGGTNIVHIDDTKALFPIAHYHQSVAQAIPADDAGYQQPVMDTDVQQRLLTQFKDHYYGLTEQGASPWNPLYIRSWLERDGSNSIAAIEDYYLKKYTQETAQVFAQNFRPRSQEWKQGLADNTDIAQFQHPAPEFNPHDRAISVTETSVRVLPTEGPGFSDPTEAGQGYPFDNLQNSSIRPATPLYILGTSRDRAWYLVLAPEVLGWAHSDAVARTSPQFISQWRHAANKQLGSVVADSIPVIDTEQHFRFTARTGTVLPLIHTTDTTHTALVPVRDSNGNAQIHHAVLDDLPFQPMPLAPTPANYAQLIAAHVGQPYGWGSLYADNDCSAELRALMMPFGVFLPRNSYDQSMVGQRTDLSHLDTQQRLDYLASQGKPFTTLVYIKGHIMLYIGNTLIDGKTVPLTYQNVWGLRPEDGSRRSIIGQSVVFPLLKSYPEDTSLRSLAGGDTFIITDVLTPNPDQPAAF